ncbi:MAG: Lipoprotein signal peptidase [Myxococcota bacterium]|nr:Lipoprotein signal peptidase [Myxococcota bacterium]
MKWLKHRIVFLALVVLASAALDQWTKWLAVEHLTKSFDRRPDMAFTDKVKLFLTEHHMPFADDPSTHHLYGNLKPDVVIMDGLFNFAYRENRGAAGGFLADQPAGVRIPFFLVISAAALVFILGYYRKLTDEQWHLRWGLALVLGGAVGNFIDRILRQSVVDFIHWYWKDPIRMAYPTFNIADAAITVGVGVLILDMIIQGVRERKKSSGTPPDNGAAENAG